jgi:hypothetical protein
LGTEAQVVTGQRVGESTVGYRRASRAVRTATHASIYTNAHSEGKNCHDKTENFAPVSRNWFCTKVIGINKIRGTMNVATSP